MPLVIYYVTRATVTFCLQDFSTHKITIATISFTVKKYSMVMDCHKHNDIESKLNHNDDINEIFTTTGKTAYLQ